MPFTLVLYMLNLEDEGKAGNYNEVEDIGPVSNEVYYKLSKL